MKELMSKLMDIYVIIRRKAPFREIRILVQGLSVDYPVYVKTRGSVISKQCRGFGGKGETWHLLGQTLVAPHPR